MAYEQGGFGFATGVLNFGANNPNSSLIVAAPNDPHLNASGVATAGIIYRWSSSSSVSCRLDRPYLNLLEDTCALIAIDCLLIDISPV